MKLSHILFAYFLNILTDITQIKNINKPERPMEDEEWVMPTGKIHCYTLISHPVEFRRILSNSCSVDIARVKNVFGSEPRPLGWAGIL